MRASSLKRRRWRMKRGEDGVAVKISVPLQGTGKFWEPQESEGQSPLALFLFMQICVGDDLCVVPQRAEGQGPKGRVTVRRVVSRAGACSCRRERRPVAPQAFAATVGENCSADHRSACHRCGDVTGTPPSKKHHRGFTKPRWCCLFYNDLAGRAFFLVRKNQRTLLVLCLFLLLSK